MPALPSPSRMSVESQVPQLRTTSRSSRRDRIPISLSSFFRHLDCLQSVSLAYVSPILIQYWHITNFKKKLNLVSLLLHQSKLVSMLPQELVELVLSISQRTCLVTAFLYIYLFSDTLYFQFLISLYLVQE